MTVQWVHISLLASVYPCMQFHACMTQTKYNGSEETAAVWDYLYRIVPFVYVHVAHMKMRLGLPCLIQCMIIKIKLLAESWHWMATISLQINDYFDISVLQYFLLKRHFFIEVTDEQYKKKILYLV